MRDAYLAPLLAVALLATALSAPSASAPPPPIGDWVVTGTEVVDNATVTANGSVYVAAGATLVLDNATLRINATADGNRRLQVNATGTLVLRNAVVEGVNPLFYYRFLVYGAMDARNATLRHLWGSPGDPFPGGVQVVGGSLYARGLRVEELRTAGVHVVQGTVDVDGLSVGHHYRDGVYLNRTVGARLANVTLELTSLSTAGAGVFIRDSSWINLTGVVSENHLAGEIDVSRSDNVTIREARLNGEFDPGALVAATSSADIALLDSVLRNSPSGFSAGPWPPWARGSSLTVQNVTFEEVDGVWATRSALFLEDVVFSRPAPGWQSSYVAIGDNSTLRGSDLSTSPLEETVLNLNMGENSTALLDRVVAAQVYLGGYIAVVELTNSTSVKGGNPMGIACRSRVVLRNHTETREPEGSWPLMYVDTGACYDPANPSLVTDHPWLDVRAVGTDGSPLAGADVRVTDDGVPVYASPAFGGADARTGPDGRTPPFPGPYRALHRDRSSSSRPFANITYNATVVSMSKPGYLFLPWEGVVLDEGFEDGDRAGWRTSVWSRFGTGGIWGTATVLPGSLDGTGAYLLEVEVQRDYEAHVIRDVPLAVYARDYAVEADLRLDAGEPTSSLSLWAFLPSATDLYDGYRVNLSLPDDVVVLSRYDRFNATELARAPLVVDAEVTYHVRVEPDGDLLRVLVDGAPVLEVTDATYRSGSVAAGVGTGAPGIPGPFARAHVDNLRVVGKDGRTFVGDRDPPAIASAAVTDPADIGAPATIRAVVMDDLGVDAVVAEVSGPSGPANLTMTEVQAGLWVVPYVPTLEGPHAVTVWARDRAGWWASRATSFTAVDLSPPTFLDASVLPQSLAPGGTASFATNATDNVAVTAAFADVAGPEAVNLTLAQDANETWRASRAFTAIGAYAVTFRATDAAGHWASTPATFAVGDGSPPTTTHAVLGPNATVGAVTYLGPAATIALSATDDIAVASTEYRFDAAPWQPFGVPFPIPPGPHLLEYRSTDAAGNVEPAHALLVHGDVAPPDVALTVAGPRVGDALGPAATLALAATDDASGTASLEYRIDGGPWIPYAAPVPAGTEGPHTLEWSATDRVGNAADGSFAYAVDATGPTVTLTAGTPFADPFVSPATPFTVTASDPVGLSTVEYRTDGSAWVPYTAPFPLAAGGLHTVEARATDALGNPSATAPLSVTVDGTPPALALAVDGPNGTWDGVAYVGAEAMLSLAATDGGSGLALMEYTFGGGAWTAYASPFDLTGYTGTVPLALRATDRVGNAATSDRTLVVDVATPLVGISVPSATVGGLDTTFAFVAVATEDTRVVSYAWTFGDGASGEGVSATHAYAALGTYEVEVTVTDAVGRTGRSRVTVAVEAPWDGDRDGLPDAWELEHFGGLAQDGAGDPDGDGVANADEWRRGTDPNVADHVAGTTDFPWWALAGYPILAAVLTWVWWDRRRRGQSH